MEILELKDIITVINNPISGFNRKLDIVKQRICKLEDRTVESIQFEWQEEKDRMWNEEKSIRDYVEHG